MLGIADRLDILEVILPILISEYNMPSADELIHFKDYYINKVNMFRNRLGHVKLGEQVLHIQGKDVPIDQASKELLQNFGTTFDVYQLKGADKTGQKDALVVAVDVKQIAQKVAKIRLMTLCLWLQCQLLIKAKLTLLQNNSC